MIRLRPSDIIVYEELRKEYVLRLLASHALKLDNRAVIHALFPESGDKKDGVLRKEYLGGRGFGITVYHRKDLDGFPALRDMLFLGNGEINGDNLLCLLSGPEQPPNCVTGRNAPEGMLRWHFDKLRDSLIGDADLTDEQNACCKKLFDYNSVGEAAYWLLEQLPMRACPYCNLHDITFAARSRLRPEFDHFFPQSKFPYFALSMFNLIPSCRYCNGKKSEYYEPEEPLIYPYDESFDETGRRASFRLSTEKQNGAEVFKALLGDERADFSVDVEFFPRKEAETTWGKKVERNLVKLGIKDIYAAHTPDVRKLLQTYYWYDDECIESYLTVLMPEIGEKKLPRLRTILMQNARNYLFFADLERENWGSAPLNKLKADILDQLEEYRIIGLEKSEPDMGGK